MNGHVALCIQKSHDYGKVFLFFTALFLCHLSSTLIFLFHTSSSFSSSSHASHLQFSYSSSSLNLIVSSRLPCANLPSASPRHALPVSLRPDFTRISAQLDRFHPPPSALRPPPPPPLRPPPSTRRSARRRLGLGIFRPSVSHESDRRESAVAPQLVLSCCRVEHSWERS